MPLPTHLSPAILTACLNQLTPLLQQTANCDKTAARDAISALLADYQPQTNQELTLAADILQFNFLAADNLKRSFDPELPLTNILRLRSGAVSLSREAFKARRQLDKLQAARTAAVPEPAKQLDHAPPTQAELNAIQVARDIMKGKKPHKASPYGGNNYAEQLRKRAMAETIRDNSARNAQKAAEKAALASQT